MSVNVQGYGMAWGALVGDLQKNHHPGTSLSILNLIVGLFNFVRVRSRTLGRQSATLICVDRILTSAICRVSTHRHS